VSARLDRLVTAFAALFLAGFGLLPLANWIPGGLSVPWYNEVAADLLNGALIALGLGVVLAIVLGKLRAPRLGASQIAPITDLDSRKLVAISLVAFLVYGWVARLAFSAKPLLIDEIVQVFQARILAGGHFSLPAAAHQEFFSSFHVVEQGGRVYGQFPMGGPALLALGTPFGAEWLVDPLFGALAVLGFGALVRRIEPRRSVALGATLLFALAPFAVFMSGSHMNHVTALSGIVLGMWGLSRASGDAARFRDGVLSGLGFGLAASIRPIDALAFGLPAGLWLLARAIRQRRTAVLLGAGLGIALPVLLLAWANLRTTGAPLLFGYTVLWGRAHDLGFHATPWGPLHTPARGVELVNLYFLRLQSYLFEAAGPSLLPATAAFALTRRLTPFDRYLLAASALLVGCYFAYWHDGFYLGPRFMYPLLPLFALWTARFPAAIREWSSGVRGGGQASRVREVLVRSSLWAVGIAAVLGLATSVPIRVRQYRSGLLSLRFDADRAAAAAGVRGALVLVRESWGAELVARLWALGVSRPDADALYRAADPCRLELSLGALERGSIRGAAAVAALAPLRADSTHLVSAPELTFDPSLRLTRGAQYPPNCLAKLAANRGGFTLFPPLLLARRWGNVYARDLGARDSLLLRDFPGRPLYLLRPASGAVGAEPVFYPLRSDSLLEAWRAGR
jgi:hypothetical protein